MANSAWVQFEATSVVDRDSSTERPDGIMVSNALSDAQGFRLSFRVQGMVFKPAQQYD